MVIGFSKLIKGDSQLAPTQTGKPVAKNVLKYLLPICILLKSISIAGGAMISLTSTIPSEKFLTASSSS
jgi:hypothetical protein